MELHKRRKAITEPETRYFMNQILLGVQYLHNNKIIHRDLKLGNIFLNEEMEVGLNIFFILFYNIYHSTYFQIKIGDFGLATKENYEGERKRTLCGTPNYIAPEVLTKKGHSYEVDIWSIGCIMYTLLVGKPPFETQTLKDTYKRIRANEYHVPSKVGSLAKLLIRKLLQVRLHSCLKMSTIITFIIYLQDDPLKRPNIDVILQDDFMTQGYLPSRLPPSCLTMAPRFDTKVSQIQRSRGPLQEINKEPGIVTPGIKKAPSVQSEASDSCEHFLKDLQTQLAKVIASNPQSRMPCNEDECEDPKAVPLYWVSKWVDYSDKYGFGYALNDDSIGVVFNDLTKLLLLSDGR